MRLQAGQQIGPYELLAWIGAGGMGEVYRARDTRLDRAVAIKVLPEHIAHRKDLSARLEREARLVASLNHPNICILHDIGQQNGAAYLVMELIEGETLAARIARGALPLAQAIEFAGQIGDALDRAHRAGVTHRDVKPQNIMLTRHGVKVLDFGLAGTVRRPAIPEETVAASFTTRGTVMGTPQYMAPEQFAGKEADARSDVWAFGAVLFEMVTGRKAFEGESYRRLAETIIAAEPRPMQVKPPPPCWLERLVWRCLAKDPEDRYQSMRDVVLELRAPVAEDRKAPLKPTRARWIGPAAVILLVASVLIGRAMQQRRAPPDRINRFQLYPPEGAQFDPVRGFALSPDGGALCFFASGIGKSGLWVRKLDLTTARLLPGTEEAFSPFWSPDSRSIAYWALGKLWRLDVGGGAPLAICDESFFVGGDWASNGSIVFGSGTSGLRQVADSGGTSAILTAPDTSRGEISLLNPQLMPGGSLLFMVEGKPGLAGIYATKLSNPRLRKRLVATSANGVYAANHLLWLRGSTLVAQRFDPGRLELSGEPQAIADPVGVDGFSRPIAAVSGDVLVHGRSGGWQLSWMDRSGHSLDPEHGRLGPVAGYSTFRISPDGGRVAVSRKSEGGSDLWMVDVQRDTWSRLTFLLRQTEVPIWSSDSRHVVFAAGSPANLYRKEASGAGAEHRVFASAYPCWPTDWSRDGRFLLYTEFSAETQGDLWVLPVTAEGEPEAGRKALSYVHTKFNEWGGRFSPQPSPRWVAYASDESGRFEIYVQAFPVPSGKFQISTGGGTHPEWGPGGRELYYVAPERRLMVVDLKSGPDWIRSSNPRVLTVLPTNGGEIIQPYEVTPDGKRLLLQTSTGGSQSLEVVLNWQTLLR